MVENLESVSIAAVVGSVIGSIVTTIVKTHNLKKILKEEIVDPDINSLKVEIKRLNKELQDSKTTFKEELARMTNENNKLSDKLDKNFFELNRKFDDNSKEVANIQGMVTVMFNAMKQNYYEQQ